MWAPGIGVGRVGGCLGVTWSTKATEEPYHCSVPAPQVSLVAQLGGGWCLRSGTGGRAATSPPGFAAELEVHVTMPQIQERELGDFRSPTFRGHPPLFSWPCGDEAVVSKLDTSITQPDHEGSASICSTVLQHCCTWASSGDAAAAPWQQPPLPALSQGT